MSGDVGCSALGGVPTSPTGGSSPRQIAIPTNLLPTIKQHGCVVKSVGPSPCKLLKFTKCTNVDGGQSCRDIKLENIFIGADGRVKLGDFGLTMSMKQEVAISPVGTVEYMAPEVDSICTLVTISSS